MKDNSNKHFWEKTAKIYTFSQEKSNKETYQILCEKLKHLFNKEQSVLELACGTGQLTTYLAEKSKNWIATDFSKNMVEETKKRINIKNVSFDVQDATNLTYENKKFDVVLIANALHIMPEPEKALKEIKRVLKEDGILIAPTFVYDGKINKMRLFLMEKIGFISFNKWKSKEYYDFIENNGFKVESEEVIKAKLLPECVLICKIK